LATKRIVAIAVTKNVAANQGSLPSTRRLLQGLAGRLAFDGSSEPVAEARIVYEPVTTAFHITDFAANLGKMTLAEMDHRCLLQKGYRPRRFFPNRLQRLQKFTRICLSNQNQISRNCVHPLLNGCAQAAAGTQ
jgi:hypothetical protein